MILSLSHTSALQALFAEHKNDTAQDVLAGVDAEWVRAPRSVPLAVARWLVLSTAWCESNFRADAIGDSGESAGVLQFHESNLPLMSADELGEWIAGDWRMDPFTSGRAAVRYLEQRVSGALLTDEQRASVNLSRLVAWNGVLAGAEDAAVAGRWLWRYSPYVGTENVLKPATYQPNATEAGVFELGRAADINARAMVGGGAAVASLLLPADSYPRILTLGGSLALAMVATLQLTNRLPWSPA